MARFGCVRDECSETGGGGPVRPTPIRSGGVTIARATILFCLAGIHESENVLILNLLEFATFHPVSIAASRADASNISR
jgi:hypothetical protein